MFTRCVAISNILLFTLINGEGGWWSPVLKRAKLPQGLGFKLIPPPKKITHYRCVLSSAFPQQVGWLLCFSYSRSQSGQNTRVASLLRSFKLVQCIHYFSCVTKTIPTSVPTPVNPTVRNLVIRSFPCCSWGYRFVLGSKLIVEGPLSTLKCLLLQ